MDEVTCQKTIHMTDDWGKAGKRKCGKIAKKYIGDLPVCEHHYNKWVKKMNKRVEVSMKIYMRDLPVEELAKVVKSTIPQK